MTTVNPATKQQLIKMAYSQAYQYEQSYGSCPQCVFAAIQDVLELGDDEAFKASYALAGGGGLSTKGTCGALAGGMMAISARYGRERESFGRGRYRPCLKLANQLLERFVAEFGSPICADVQTKLMGRSFDMWDDQDFKAFEEAGGHRDKCPSVVGKVAMWTAEMLLEAEEEAQKA